MNMEDAQTYPTRVVDHEGKSPQPDLESAWADVEAVLTPERRALLGRTLGIRTAIGRVRTDSTELVRRIRESGD
jgi:hypothetical protein